MKFLLLLLLMMSLVACSGSKSTNEAEGEDAGVELADADEFSEDGEESEDDEFGEEEEGFEEETAESEGEESLGEEAPSEEIADNSEAVEQEAVMEEEQPVQASSSMEMSGDEGNWTVSRNETLMIIAFKIYGDYDKWREIARMNSDKLGGRYHVSEGMKLRYNAPSQPFVWNPEGNPYLIQRGDTLGTISSTTYGTKKYWRNIWNNNKPLIKNPKIIFAGFTIYTPLIEGRDVANDM